MQNDKIFRGAIEDTSRRPRQRYIVRFTMESESEIQPDKDNPDESKASVEDEKADEQMAKTVSSTVSSEEGKKDKSYTVHVAVQAYDYEIERGNSVLPPRKRTVPSKFSDYKDPGNMSDDDKDDEEYVPLPPKASGRGRGRPKKAPTVGAGPTESGSSVNNPAPNTEKPDDFPFKYTSKRGRKLKYKSFTAEELDEIRSFRCADCGQTFISANALRRHSTIKHEAIDALQEVKVKTERTLDADKKTLSCEKCNKQFSLQGSLNAHMKTHDKPLYMCDICSTVFKTAESLKRHKMSHLGIKPFECDTCLKKFSSNVALREHRARHNDSKPYECKTCQRRFRQVSVYKRHLITHTTDKPFQCEICDMSFSQKIYLRSHMKKHTGEKPYKCDLCEKKFAHASDKVRHQKAHAGEKPYACEICHTRFTDPSSCRRHVKEHKSAQNFTCDTCGETFKRKLSLRTHVSKRHEVPPDTKQDMNLQVLGNQRIVLLSPSGHQISTLTQLVDQNGQKLLTEIETDTDGIIPAGATVLGAGTDPPSEQVVLLSANDGLAETGNDQGALTDATQQFIQKIESQFAVQSGIESTDGSEVQVAYHVIHDDDNQQILEIQYDRPQGEEDSTGVQVIESSQARQSMDTDSMAQQDLLSNVSFDTGARPDTSLRTDMINMQNIPSHKEVDDTSVGVLNSEHVYVRNIDTMALQKMNLTSEEQASIQDIIRAEYEGEQPPGAGQVRVVTNQHSHEPPSLEGIPNLPAESQPIENQPTFRDAEGSQVTGDIQQSSNLQIESSHELRADTCHIKDSQATSQHDDIDSPADGSSLSILDSMLTKAFVSAPDFSSQDYYNWLSAFTDHCKQIELPLNECTFRDISQVQKSLSDIMATPKGILAHKDNFRILLSISGDLSSIITQHLLCVLQELESQE